MARENYREVKGRLFGHVDAEFVSCNLGFPEGEGAYSIQFYPWWENPQFTLLNEANQRWQTNYPDEAMSTIQPNQQQIAQIRDDWMQAVAHLEEQIAEWVQSEGWQVRSEEKEMNEESIGSYKVPDLFIETPEGGRLILEVKGRGAIEGSGRVQFMAWPTLFRVHLLYKGGNAWIIRTDSGIPLRQPWNRDTFLTLAKDLLGAE